MSERQEFVALLLIIAAFACMAAVAVALPQVGASTAAQPWAPAPYAPPHTLAVPSATLRPTVMRTAKVWPGTARPAPSCTPWPTSIYWPFHTPEAQ